MRPFFRLTRGAVDDVDGVDGDGDGVDGGDDEDVDADYVDGSGENHAKWC